MPWPSMPTACAVSSSSGSSGRVAQRKQAPSTRSKPDASVSAASVRRTFMLIRSMAQDSGVSPSELRRDVTVWGSFMWGYADVGADIYAALGLVIAHAAGAAPLAFMLAGIVYIIIGLAYTELASAYPVAGGGQYFTMRGLGDFWGYVAGP